MSHPLESLDLEAMGYEVIGRAEALEDAGDIYGTNCMNIAALGKQALERAGITGTRLVAGECAHRWGEEPENVLHCLLDQQLLNATRGFRASLSTKPAG